MSAPVCPISRSQPVSNTPPALSPIVQATDLPSAITALKQIITALQQLVFPPGINNVAPFGGVPSPAQATSSGQLKPPNWVEVGRTVDQMRVNNADDDTLWVEVDVIKDITFRDETSGNFLHWKLDQ